MLRYINEADVVVCHAGVGTVLCTLRAGRTPVVLPRLKALGETVDDHQLEFTSALVDIGAVVRLDVGTSLAGPARKPRRGRGAVALEYADRVVDCCAHGDIAVTCGVRAASRGHLKLARRPPLYRLGVLSIRCRCKSCSADMDIHQKSL